MIYYIINSDITPTIHISTFETDDGYLDISLIGTIKKKINMIELNNKLKARIGENPDLSYLKRLIQLRILLMLMNHCRPELDIVKHQL